MQRRLPVSLLKLIFLVSTCFFNCTRQPVFGLSFYPPVSLFLCLHQNSSFPDCRDGFRLWGHVEVEMPHGTAGCLSPADLGVPNLPLRYLQPGQLPQGAWFSGSGQRPGTWMILICSCPGLRTWKKCRRPYRADGTLTQPLGGQHEASGSCLPVRVEIKECLARSAEEADLWNGSER